MTRVTLEESAKVDIAVALRSIQNFFISKESPELGRVHINLFKAELREARKILAKNPEIFPVRPEYDRATRYGRLYRSFTIHWFIVFYTYAPSEGVIIWHVRSSRSDYSTIIMLP